MASTNRALRRDKRSAQELLIHVANQKVSNFKFSIRSVHPTLLISYEKVIANPEGFVNELSQFLGLSPSNELRRKTVAFLKPGQYKSLNI